MADISETLLQAAQVINQSYSMLAQAQTQQNELEAKRQNYEEMAKAREETLAYREQALQAKQEKDALQAQNEAMRTEISLKNSESMRITAETGVQNAATSAKRAATEDYSARIRAAALVNKVSEESAVKLQKELNVKVVGVATGDPELDKGLIFETPDQIQHKYGQARDVVFAGAPLPAALQQEARLLKIPDQDYAAREMARYEKLMQFRDAFAKEKLIPEYKQKEANVLSAMSYLDAAKQTSNLSAQNQQSAQMRQSSDPGAQAAMGAPPGIIAGQLTPETQAGLTEIAGFTDETLGNPSGFNASAQRLANLIRARKLAGDHAGATALGAAAVNRNPGLANRANEYFKAFSGQQK